MKLKLSRLCYGTLTLGPLQKNLAPEAAGELISYALSRGINFFDTAQFYKNYPHIKHGIDARAIIASKTYAYEYDAAIQAVEEARKALDRDVIDIFMLHEQESEYTFAGHKPALDALYTLKARGTIKAVGASMHRIAAVRAATKLGLDIIHPLINLAGLGIGDGTRKEMENAIHDAHDAGIYVYTMKALGGGNLFSRASECLNYILDLPFVDSVAVGMQSVEEIDANLSFFETRSFSPSDIDRLREKKRKLLIEDWCVGCGKCAEACGQNAIRIVNSRAVCDASKCVLCGYCSGHCAEFCIKII